MSRLTKQHFWEWFRRNNQEYLTLKSKSKKDFNYWLNEMTNHLRAYFRGFGFSIENSKGDKPAILTITVSGKCNHFKKADALVAKAPEIPGWNIVSLENPMPIDFMLEQQMEKTNIDPREFCFSFMDNDPDSPILIVFHPLCTPENEYDIYFLAHTAVYNLLGERSFGNDIHSIRVENLSYADPDNIQELEALPTVIGVRTSAMVVDSQGSLVKPN